MIDKANYKITFTPGLITITPRPITVTTQGYTGVFDGITRSWPDLTVKNPGEKSGLCTEVYHRFDEITPLLFQYLITNRDNEVKFIIIDADEVDVTDNYDISYEWGKVTITKRPIEIKTDDIEFIYDGTEHWDSDLHVKNQDTAESDQSGLCVNAKHYFDEVKYPTFKNVADSGVNKNIITFIIADKTGFDVTWNYEIVILEDDYGDVNISKREVHIHTDSESWIYDGKVHSSGNYECVEGSIAEGQGACADLKTQTTITEVGTAENFFELSVFDANGQNVTENYEIIIDKKGTLEVTKRHISIESGSTQKHYDGKPLTLHKLQTTGGTSLAQGDELQAEFSGTITEVGKTENTFDPTTVKIFNSKGKDVTHCYDIDENYVLGVLEVLERSQNDDYDIQHPEDPPKMDLFVITTDKTGTLYLKSMSYGEYNGKGFLAATAYDPLILDYASAQYLTAFALKNYGTPVSNVTIRSLYGQYILPYYATPDNLEMQLSDIYVMGDASSEYHLMYFARNDRWDRVSVPEELLAFEAEYRRFVYEQYTKIDGETNAYMQQIIKAQGFDKNDPEIIQKVANYIQNAAVYSLNYDRTLDRESNKVIAFLSDYKEGICQHYAASATMLYRALGIPARYTVGYMVETIAGEETVINSMMGHAWVEVYIDGLGWIQVEVTGASADDPDRPQPPEEPEENAIVIAPIYQWKEFDNTPLTYDHEKGIGGNSVLQELLALGYTYEVEVGGSRTNVGRVTSRIVSFVLYDPEGNPVTDQFTIEKQTGILEIKANVIKIYLSPKKYDYTGKAVSYSPEDCRVVSELNGLRFEVLSIQGIELTDVGVLNSAMVNPYLSEYLTFAVYTENGENVAENYSVVIVHARTGEDYDMITIKQSLLEIATGSAQKTDDGDALTCDEVILSKGYLAEGHQIKIEVTGKQVGRGSSENRVSWETFRVEDENGNDVTHNYTVYDENGIRRFKFGTLTII